MSLFVELQCDGLVGPTHNYAGLSYGNIASQAHARTVSNPKKAALQGLEKMKFVHDMGLPQLVIPPHPRPNLSLLRQEGFSGSDADILTSSADMNPALLAAAWSASSMWAANMATVSPAPDTTDHALHMTPANLSATRHRSQEADFSFTLLQAIFGQVATIHPPLPMGLSDEGAANHMRLCGQHGTPGVEVFVYGRQIASGPSPTGAFPARQMLEASCAIADLHALPESRRVFVQQNPAAINAGVFHNDVIAMSNENVLIYHERAFLEEERCIDELKQKLYPMDLAVIRVTEETLPLEAAVSSYFFNAQIVTVKEGKMAILAPFECRELPLANTLLQSIKSDPDNPIARIHYLDVRESMKNGGGPACLRLRVPLGSDALNAIPQDLFFDEMLYTRLTKLIATRYRDRLAWEDLHDPSFAKEVEAIHEDLYALFGLSHIY